MSFDFFRDESLATISFARLHIERQMQGVLRKILCQNYFDTHSYEQFLSDLHLEAIRHAIAHLALFF